MYDLCPWEAFSSAKTSNRFVARDRKSLFGSRNFQDLSIVSRFMTNKSLLID
jgi:hypothetical protein